MWCGVCCVVCVVLTCPSVGPSGGAGLAIPAGIWQRISAATALLMMGINIAPSCIQLVGLDSRLDDASYTVICFPWSSTHRRKREVKKALRRARDTLENHY